MSAAQQIVSSGATCRRGNLPQHVSSDDRGHQRKRPSILRSILDWFDDDPKAALTTADIAMHVYGIEFSAIEKKHRVAVIRAMRNAIEQRAELRGFDGDGPDGQFVIFNSHDVESYGLARLKADWIEGYQRPRCWKPSYRNRPESDLKAVLSDERHSKLIAEGGIWHRHVEKNRAEDSGDRLTYLECERELIVSKMRWLGETADLVRDLDDVDRELNGIRGAP